jgi:predicted Co/Zn/Cd cation transporter (cation efflux family)
MEKIEKRSLAAAKWANLFMGAAGIVAAIASNASALMLDGLFSGVNFLAARVAASIQRKPDAVRPFGYEIDESMYVMFRSLVLTGIIIVAGFNACDKIVTYVRGGNIPSVKLDWVVVYMLLMMVVCSGLAFWYHRNWLKTDRQSVLLKTERSASIIDGVLSAAAGAAFLANALLEQTSLSFLVPISDAVVVIALALYMIPKPIRSFSKAVQEVLGESAPGETVERVRTTIVRALTGEPFRLLQVAVTRLGRSLFAVAYVQPESVVTAKDLDHFRKVIDRACQANLASLRMEVIYTAKLPY